MPLVYTTNLGANPNILQLSSAAGGVERPLLQELTSGIVRNTTPTDGLLNWDLSGPLLLTALPAGHTPGIYNLQTTLYMRVAAATGNVNGIILSWSEPGVGVTTNVFGNLNVTSLGLILSGIRTVSSDGTAPLTVSITPNLITGAPRANVMACAPYQSLPFF
jgi:hypothetical protein